MKLKAIINGQYNIVTNCGKYTIVINNGKVISATKMGVWCVGKSAKLILDYFQKRGSLVRRIK